MKTFEISVSCQSGGSPHRHSIVVKAGDSVVYNVAPPSNVRLQYTCPVTRQALVATFAPPAGFARPFAIASVT